MGDKAIKKIASYGTWDSPFTPEMTTRYEKSTRNCDIILYKGACYWTEGLPLEKGRTVVMQRQTNGKLTNLTPVGFDVRSKVHEYGGVAFTLYDDHLYFTNSQDQQLYIQALPTATCPSSMPKVLTKKGWRFADLQPYRTGIIAIGENHETHPVTNFLCLISYQTGEVKILDEGHDFYASPALSADQRNLTWLTWDHPHMPWDRTSLWTACLVEDYLEHKKEWNKGQQEAILQPQWSPKGSLFFLSDREGWWNLYRLQGEQFINVCPLEADFGQPLWRLGTSSWRFTGREEQILCTYRKAGTGQLALLDPNSRALSPLSLPFTDYGQLTVSEGTALCLMGNPFQSRCVMQLDLNSFACKQIDSMQKLVGYEETISYAERICFPSTAGREAYGYLYAPRNQNFQAEVSALPPLMVLSHGGPTAAADPVFNLRIQYWTSRGFALLDVDYGGSTGYGRAYRERLQGKWGLVDVEDCLAGATYLANQQQVDPQRMVIRGGSAGGFTTLTALTQSSLFAAGASYYGVGDLERLLHDTHKFEAHYLDSLIGPYPAQQELYHQRSPLFQLEKLCSPIIFFQGEQDKIVPPNQAKTLYQALKKRGIKTELILYPLEEHGFRHPATICDSLEKELKFYLEVFSMNKSK